MPQLPIVIIDDDLDDRELLGDLSKELRGDHEIRYFVNGVEAAQIPGDNVGATIHYFMRCEHADDERPRTAGTYSEYSSPSKKKYSLYFSFYIRR